MDYASSVFLGHCSPGWTVENDGGDFSPNNIAFRKEGEGNPTIVEYNGERLRYDDFYNKYGEEYREFVKSCGQIEDIQLAFKRVAGGIDPVEAALAPDENYKPEEYTISASKLGYATVLEFRGKRYTLNRFFDMEYEMPYEEKRYFGVRYPYFYDWSCMMSSCYHKANNGYPYEGGPGITVCEEWHSPEGFHNWVNEWIEKNGPIDRKHSFRRRNWHDGNYCPDNCYFGPFIPGRN